MGQRGLEVAQDIAFQTRLTEFLKEHRQRVRNGNGEVLAKVMFHEAAEIHL
jgi:hypothetical protein